MLKNGIKKTVNLEKGVKCWNSGLNIFEILLKELPAEGKEQYKNHLRNWKWSWKPLCF